MKFGTKIGDGVNTSTDRRFQCSRLSPPLTVAVTAFTWVQDKTDAASMAHPSAQLTNLSHTAYADLQAARQAEIGRKASKSMKTMNITRPLLLAATAFSLVAQTTTTSAQRSGPRSPAEQSIDKAKDQIARKPGYAGGYNALAMAMARRARETSDVHYYAEAENALSKSFQVEPDNFEGLKVKTWLLLGRHEFAKALDIAKRLNQQIPDDVLVYGYLTDANIGLGNYDSAENAAQWMLNLRAGTFRF